MRFEQKKKIENIYEIVKFHLLITFTGYTESSVAAGLNTEDGNLKGLSVKCRIISIKEAFIKGSVREKRKRGIIGIRQKISAFDRY